MVIDQVESAMLDMQRQNPLIKFVIIEEAAVMPTEVVMTAISPIILVRHPIFESHLGFF